MTCLESLRLLFQSWPLRLGRHHLSLSETPVGSHSQKHSEPKLCHQHREFEISYFPVLMTLIDYSLVKALEAETPAKPCLGPYPTETEAQ